MTADNFFLYYASTLSVLKNKNTYEGYKNSIIIPQKPFKTPYFQIESSR